MGGKGTVPGLAKRLKQRREGLGLSQAELAARMNNVKSTPLQISHYEAERRMPSAESLIHLADALECSVDWLLGRTSKP